MRTIIHDLNSLREIVRKLQKENTNLKKLLDDHDIEYDSEEIIDASITVNSLGLYGLYERYDMGEAIVRERIEKAFSDIYKCFNTGKIRLF